MTFYRRNLPHLQRDGRCHFLTFCTHHRWVLPEWARDIVFDTCIRAHGWTIDLHVLVVMPDHVHMIFVPEIDREAQEVVPLARITKAIKGASSHLINRAQGTSGRIWQEESFDHVLRSSESLKEKIEYLLNNPVRGGLVTNPAEYRWLWQKAFKNPYAPGLKLTRPAR